MNIEYKGRLKKFCPAANAMNFNSLKKTLALKAPARRAADLNDPGP